MAINSSFSPEDLIAAVLRKFGLSPAMGSTFEMNVAQASYIAVFRFEDTVTLLSKEITKDDSFRVRVAKLEDWAEQLKAEVDRRVLGITGKYYAQPSTSNAKQPHGWYGYFGDAGGPSR